jgi:hypothetical protein
VHDLDRCPQLIQEHLARLAASQVGARPGRVAVGKVAFQVICHQLQRVSAPDRQKPAGRVQMVIH